MLRLFIRGHACLGACEQLFGYRQRSALAYTTWKAKATKVTIARSVKTSKPGWIRITEKTAAPKPLPERNTARFAAT